jgi:hypothetical protein
MSTECAFEKTISNKKNPFTLPKRRKFLAAWGASSGSLGGEEHLRGFQRDGEVRLLEIPIVE